MTDEAAVRAMRLAGEQAAPRRSDATQYERGTYTELVRRSEGTRLNVRWGEEGHVILEVTAEMGFGATATFGLAILPDDARALARLLEGAAETETGEHVTNALGDC